MLSAAILQISIAEICFVYSALFVWSGRISYRRQIYVYLTIGVGAEWPRPSLLGCVESIGKRFTSQFFGTKMDGGTYHQGDVHSCSVTSKCSCLLWVYLSGQRPIRTDNHWATKADLVYDELLPHRLRRANIHWTNLGNGYVQHLEFLRGSIPLRCGTISHQWNFSCWSDGCRVLRV